MSQINGKANRYDGAPVDYVLIFDWATGRHIHKSIPNSAGDWAFSHYVNLNCGITYVSDGCEPITHGAYQFLATWEPQSLIDTNELKVWLDPSDLSTMYQDAGQTIPVTADGQPVGLIKDKSGNNYHASQSVNAARPIYRTDGVLHWLDFNGTSQYLVITNSDWFNTVSATTWVFGANISSASQQFGAVISKLNESYYGLAIQTSDPANGEIRAFGFRDSNISFNDSINNNAVFTLSFIDGSELSLAKNKGAPVLSSSTLSKSGIDSSGSLFTIGRLSYMDLFSKMNFYGLMITNTKLVDYREPTIGYIAGKSGVTL